MNKFLSYVVHKQTDKHTNRRTGGERNINDYITSVEGEGNYSAVDRQFTIKGTKQCRSGPYTLTDGAELHTIFTVAHTLCLKRNCLICEIGSI